MKIKEVACVDHSEFEKQNQLCCMARRMENFFDKYWNSYSVVLSFAVILDPRYKLQFVEWCYVKLLGSEGVQRSIRGSRNIPSNDLHDFRTYESKLCEP